MWIAVDEDGKINLFINKPERYAGFWFNSQENFKQSYLPLPEGIYPQLTWEHEPVEVILTTSDTTQFIYNLGYKDGQLDKHKDNKSIEDLVESKKIL